MSSERIGRYLIFEPIASGGMATVHFGTLLAEAGFSRIVAVKRLKTGRRSRSMLKGLLDEARLVSRIKHPNVVPILDVVLHEGEVVVVLEYVVGESLARLLKTMRKAKQLVPADFATTIVASVLHGLHAAHDAKSARGKPLGIVHRDVSPQNVMVGVDGHARVLDFGIAKAEERLSRSVAGQVKGKLAYMAPEQLEGEADRRSDIYAAAVVLWEMLSGKRLFTAAAPGDLIEQKLASDIAPPSAHRSDVSPELDAIVMRGLAKHAADRFDSAREMALALEDVRPTARATLIGAWVQELAGDELAERAAIVEDLEMQAADEIDDDPSILGESTLNASGRLTVREGSGSSGEIAKDPADTEDTVRDVKQVRSAVHETLQSPVSVGTEDILAASTARPPDKRQAGGMFAVAAVLAGAVLGFLVLRKDSTQVAPSTVASAEPAPSTSAPAPAPEPSATVEPSVAPAPAPTPAPEPAVEAPKPRVGSPARPAPAPAPVPEPAPPAVKKNCDPPYVVDERGVRRLKPECM